MARKDALFAILAITAGVFLVTRADADIGDYFAQGEYVPPPDDSEIMPTAEQKINAFSQMITSFESNGDYSVLFGGGHFSDYSQHPNIRVPFFNREKNKQDYSTAAGAWQINYPTWSTEIQPVLHLPDFSPQSQDIAGQFLLKKTGAIPYITSDNIPYALQLASRKWASLPGSNAQQNPQPLDIAITAYNTFLGIA